MKTKQEIKEEIIELYAAQKAFGEVMDFAHKQQMDAMKNDDDIQDYVRPWVELTDHEIEMIYAVTVKVRKKDIMPGEQKMFAKTIQHFLKERNT